ncbi:MAG: hypothetical protein RLZZ612_1972 [Pseudomonadota bacterium]|jgi:hypothetical protein
MQQQTGILLTVFLIFFQELQMAAANALVTITRQSGFQFLVDFAPGMPQLTTDSVKQGIPIAVQVSDSKDVKLT